MCVCLVCLNVCVYITMKCLNLQIPLIQDMYIIHIYTHIYRNILYMCVYVQYVCIRVMCVVVCVCMCKIKFDLIHMIRDIRETKLYQRNPLLHKCTLAADPPHFIIF